MDRHIARTIVRNSAGDARVIWSIFSGYHPQELRESGASVKMAEESGSLFCDEDETCEKNTSESDEDGEEYVSAPLGNLRIALFLSIRWLQPFPLSFSHPRLSPCFVVILYISTSRLLEKPFYCTAMCAFFILKFIYYCFSFADKLGPCGRWLRHRLLSSILIGTPPLVALQVKFSFLFNTP